MRDAYIPFEIVAARVDESGTDGETAVERVLRLAQAKATAGANAIRMVVTPDAPALVVGADTEVVIDGEVLGKPESDEHARSMLRRLAGRTHEVITGVAVIRLPSGERQVEHEVTQVRFAPLTDEQIAAYVASGEHRDKAGGYAIQGRGGTFVTRVEGCYFNVVGLPLARLYRMLREMGWGAQQ